MSFRQIEKVVHRKVHNSDNHMLPWTIAAANKNVQNFMTTDELLKERRVGTGPLRL